MIKISKQNDDNYLQIFSLFTEEIWQKNKEKYGKSVQNFFTGKKNEVFILTENETVNYLIGVGKNSLQNFEFQQIANKFSNYQKRNLQPVKTKLEAENFDQFQIEEFLKGLFLGTYAYPFKKNHPLWDENFEIHINNKESDLNKVSETIEALCEGQFTAMDWLNKPANFKTTPILSEFLKKLSEEKNLKYQSFNRAECLEMGLGAFAAVNTGSAHEAAFTILEYNCGDSSAKTLGLVGKCVLFDTGGISLKNPENMHYMKSDMGGATAVIGTLIAASGLQLPVNIVAVLPATDNAISASAYLPSDVVTAYNGKTIEVLNTDAEGRMTLADGLAYLTKNYKTDSVIDLATLTGSAVRMFGDTCGALFSNDENLKKQLEDSGNSVNQRLWNLPLWDVWSDEIKSDVADLRNISMKPIGDCIVAAKFLENFINDHPSWAHLDIAGVAFGSVNYSKEKAATGFGVQLLLNFIKNFI